MKLFRKHIRKIATFLAINIIVEIFAPAKLWALTSGPTQPEVQSFQPVSISDMVNPFTGDFSYNIPLIDVDGYPINLAYNSGITNDAEASWVGLGWNINPGAINRSMRGIPDEFNGGEDAVKKEFNLRPNYTIGANMGLGAELFGSELNDMGFSLKYSLGINFNNYNGYGVEQSLSPSFSSSAGNSGMFNAGLGLNSSSSGGLTISPTISFQQKSELKEKRERTTKVSLGSALNSRAGLTELSLTANSNWQTKKGNPAGMGGGYELPIGLSSYTPSINMPMSNFSCDFSYKFGSEAVGLFANTSIKGYFSLQQMNLSDGLMTVPAYGYLNSQNASKDANGYLTGMMDINRDWEIPYNKNTPSLPITNYTYDVLSVSGQGMGGSFRPFRNDFGYVADNLAENVSNGASLSMEAGGGQLLHAGANISINQNSTVTRSWQKNNPASTTLSFKSTGDDPLYEPYSYKEMGELSVDDEPNLFESIGGSTAVRIGLENAGGFEVKTKSKFEKNDGGVIDIPTKNYRSKRIKRNQILTLLKYSELAYKGLNSNDDPLYKAPDHHIGEISVLRNDGVRYVYGIPAYNTYQEETSFSVGMYIDPKFSEYETKYVHDQSYDNSNGLFYYKTGDNSVKNKRGRDYYYSSTKMPAYAHSYLLTAVLSPDFVDVDKTRGPSAGDIGNFTMFKYKKLSKPYKWRTPYDEYGMSANFNEGLKSDPFDDQANYVYGEKEMWYLDKIETKNTIAIFVTEDRKDGFGAKNRDGGIGDVPTKLLRKISLYNRADYEVNGTNAIPIKEVHFEYDYSLCPNVPNNNGESEVVNGVDLNANKGKLTLKKVYFTYGNSYKSKFSPYEFDYTNIYQSGFNPSYGLKNYDRWGNYKPNQGNLLEPDNNMTNSEFPYSIQDKSLMDKYVTAWTLSKIHLPSGGSINIECESDDYASVQNLKAMQMFKINSIGSSANIGNVSSFLDPANNKLMEDNSYINSDRNNQYLTVKLDVPINSSISDKKATFFNNYLKGIKDLYFKFLVNIKNNNDPRYEYVNGYAEIEDYGTISYNDPGNNHNYAWIKLKEVHQGDNQLTTMVNPISKSAWHFGRKRMSKVLYSKEVPEEYSMEAFLNKVTDADFAKTVTQAIQGANGFLKKHDMGKTANLSHSFIRLNCPKGKKLGGGLRVKRIAINDEWDSMVTATGNTNTSYGQEYTYTTTDINTGETISSGVAAWEPSIGGDENPFKLPIWYGDKQEQLLMPDDESYLEGPVGESFFPSPSVGYSKVTVKNFGQNTIKRHGTGYVVNEYYTAKDFPTIVESTSIDAKPKKTKPWFKVLKIYNRDYMTVSQGYSIELNDMHGKQKAMWVYSEDATKPISGVEYKYQSKETDNKECRRLTNLATVVKPDGSTAQREIGVEYDFVADFREQKSETISGGLNTNLTSFLAAFVPSVVPLVLPTSSTEITRFRSAVATKIIYRYGILQETIAHDLGSSVSTQNLAYDSETGLVLLTKTKTNFEDDIYSLNYPAHWYYSRMGQAYKNLGLYLNNVNISSGGNYFIANADKYFVPGDELIYDNLDLAWVKEVYTDHVVLMNEMGKDFTPASSGKGMRLVRSGNRNLIGVSMGSITSLENPLPNLQTNLFTAVLNTSSQVFKEDWKTYCDCYLSADSRVKNSQNSYAIGAKGIWRAYKSFAYLTDREHTWKNNNSNIRKDGVYTSFNPFWKWLAGSYTKDETNWTWTSEITEMSPYGAELENMDALKRYSAATYGYNNTIPTSVAANARYREVGFDAMEDYGFNTCVGAHFGFRANNSNLSNQQSHTGKQSLRISVGSPISFTRTLSLCNQ